MTKEGLHDLLEVMSLEEKVGQMISCLAAFLIRQLLSRVR